MEQSVLSKRIASISEELLLLFMLLPTVRLHAVQYFLNPTLWPCVACMEEAIAEANPLDLR